MIDMDVSLPEVDIMAFTKQVSKPRAGRSSDESLSV
jgi:hypothetical protein